jgi:hypothetical protein
MVNGSTFVKDYGTWLKKYIVKKIVPKKNAMNINKIIRLKKSNLSPNYEIYP